MQTASYYVLTGPRDKHLVHRTENQSRTRIAYKFKKAKKTEEANRVHFRIKKAALAQNSWPVSSTAKSCHDDLDNSGEMARTIPPAHSMTFADHSITWSVRSEYGKNMNIILGV